MDALRSGQVDLITQISTPRFLSLQEEADIHTFSVPTNAFPIVRLRTDQTPGDDPHVIQAIKRAIDREAIFELVQQGYGAIGRDTPVGPLYSDLYTEDIPIP
ncbi:MAG: 4-phytase, partial [Anaerolineales bacterium]|nr:4-phytase [Anaerolineales bacterium]